MKAFQYTQATIQGTPMRKYGRLKRFWLHPKRSTVAWAGRWICRSALVLPAVSHLVGPAAYADETTKLPSQPQQSQSEPALVIEDPWVRAMPPGRAMTAGYLRVENTSAYPVQITGVASSAGNASLHETRMVEGKSSMRPVEDLLIEPGETLALAPGGLHIMLMGLAATPLEGELVPLCLTTSIGEACTQATVRRSAPSTERAADHNHH
ncbi:MAG: copper chaperone PCu(A)C [Pseudomonadota bacterium]